MSWYLIFAEILMDVHAALILGMFAGIAVSFWYTSIRVIQSAILIATITLWGLFGACPLTILEDYVRRLGGEPRPLLAEGFIPLYLKQWLGIHLTDATVVTGTYTLTALFFAISCYWLWERRNRIRDTMKKNQVQ